MDWNKVGKLDARSWNGRDGTVDFVSVRGNRQKLELGRGTSFEEIERMINQNITSSLATLDPAMNIHRGRFQARVEDPRTITVDVPDSGHKLLARLPEETDFAPGSHLTVHAMLVSEGGDLAHAVAVRMTPVIPAPEMDLA